MIRDYDQIMTEWQIRQGAVSVCLCVCVSRQHKQRFITSSFSVSLHRASVCTRRLIVELNRPFLFHSFQNWSVDVGTIFRANVFRISHTFNCLLTLYMHHAVLPDAILISNIYVLLNFHSLTGLFSLLTPLFLAILWQQPSFVRFQLSSLYYFRMLLKKNFVSTLFPQ